MGKADPVPLISPGSLGPERGPTEESLAREWIAIHGRNWRYDHTAGKWYAWEGPRWQRDDCRLAHYVISEHLRAAGAATKYPSIANAKTVRGVESLASANPLVALTNDRWNADPWLLGTPEGTVELRTGNSRSAGAARSGIYGALIGGVVLGVGNLPQRNPGIGDFFGSFAAGAALGGGIGLLVGTYNGRERWQRIEGPYSLNAPAR